MQSLPASVVQRSSLHVPNSFRCRDDAGNLADLCAAKQARAHIFVPPGSPAACLRGHKVTAGETH